MASARFVRFSTVVLGLSIVAGPLLPGCSGEDTPDPTLLENAPASKAKDSMDYYRKNMMKKQGRSR